MAYDEAKDPLDFAMHCAYDHAAEYLTSRPDLRRKLDQAERDLAELREKAWKYDELSK